jgi:hypothetical protein
MGYSRYTHPPRKLLHKSDYILIHGGSQEDEAPALHIITAILLYDGRTNEETFQMMQQEDAFPRLVELIGDWESQDERLHRMLLDLMYESSRIQRLTWEDLCTFSPNPKLNESHGDGNGVC